MEKILIEIGKKFELSDFELDIVGRLINAELTADEICRLTSIPKGRIYAFLNGLIDKKLIEKLDKNPATYSAQNFEARVSVFLDRVFYDNQLREKEIISALNQAEAGQIELIDNSLKYKDSILKIYGATHNVSQILREGTAPFLVYPENKSDFLHVRAEVSKIRDTFTGITESSYNFFVKYCELAMQNKLVSVADEKSIDELFVIINKIYGKIKFKAFIKGKLAMFNKSKVDFHITSSAFPYSLYVCDKRAMIAFIYEKTIVGMTTTSDTIIHVYQDAITKSYANSISFKQYVKEKYKIR